MIWTNYHSHTFYCDGKQTPEDYIVAALALKMPAYGISSHNPLPFKCDWALEANQLNHYLDEIDQVKSKYSKKIQVYKSLEIDYIPNVIGPNHKQFLLAGLDYTIGSIHFLGPNVDGKYLEIDGDYTLFLQTLQEVFKGDIKALIRQYFANIRSMLLEACPDILGHLDKIKVQSKFGTLFSEHDDFYIAEIEETLLTIKNSKAIVEVNTRGIYTGKSTETYPSQWILKRIKDMNIPITINSDAHHPSEIQLEYIATAKMLSNLGFKFLKVYLKNNWHQVFFTENGLKIPPELL